MLDETEVLRYAYSFKLNSGITKTFEVLIENNSLQIINKKDIEYPEWTKLENFACSNCTLSKSESTYCPVAINLHEIIDFFSETPSFEIAEITIESNNRAYVKRTSVQSGVSGIIGLIMPSSGCPITKKLRPLVKFHLPFSTIEETEYRVFSMYLFSQLLLKRKGYEPDWDMNKLKTLYKEILTINQNIARKIADVEKKDTSINAVVVLNNFADSVSLSLDEDEVSEYELYFKNYFNDETI